MGTTEGNLGSILRERVEVLALRQDAAGNYAWAPVRARGAAIEQGERTNLFSKIGLGARSATVTIRRDPALTLHHALRWRGQHLFLTAVSGGEHDGKQTVQTAIVEPTMLTAKPQAVKSRDALNRPTVEAVAAYTFPGVLTELYRREAEDGAPITERVQRVLVTPKEIRLKRGDLVNDGDTTWVVVRVLPLDPYKQEYVIEMQEDA